MTVISSRGRRVLAALGIAGAAIAIGATFGGAGSGRAASSAVPANTATPTISGTPQEGSTLTASDGTWSGSPTSYAYTWTRCDANGDTCAAIAGAIAKTYALVAADVGHTLRLTVTATNADGSTLATSVPTAVVSLGSVPGNSVLPAITGTVQVGAILSVSNGTWTGSPTGYTYAWNRCDTNGNACAAIGGADGPQYGVTQADAGTTLRSIVTAKNAVGSTAATSLQTAVVPVPAAPVSTGCPSGTGVIQVSDLALPARLAVDQQTVAPAVVTPAATSIQLHVRVTACDGRPVQGALVFASPVPYNQYAGQETATGADGTVTMTLAQRPGFPASTRQQLLAVFLRARQPGGSTTGGISTHRLVTFPVSLR